MFKEELITLEDNFYKVNKEKLLCFKDKKDRLAGNFIDFSNKDVKSLKTECATFLINTAINLFEFLTEEKISNIIFDVRKTGGSCDLIENRIIIGLKFLEYKEIPLELATNSILATIKHEFYHKRFTIKDWGSPNKKEITQTLSCPIRKDIFNILEDRRIEELGCKDFPGYVFHFEESRKLAFYFLKKKEILNFANIPVDYLMYFFLMPELLQDYEKKINNWLLEVPFATPDEVKSYEVLKNLVIDTLNKIKFYLKENYNLVFSNNLYDVRLCSYQIEALIPKELKDLMTKKKEETYFIDFELEDSDNVSKDLDTKDINEILKNSLKLKKEEKESKKENKLEKIENDSTGLFDFFSINSVESGTVDYNLLKNSEEISKNIFQNLGFLDSKFSRKIEEYELSEGDLDESELYGFSFNKDLFESLEDLPQYSLDFGILLDESGSMVTRIFEAKVAVLALILALKENKNINLFVYGHTADIKPKTVELYEYYNSEKNITDYTTLFNAYAKSNNADGYAIQKIGEIMSKSNKLEKVLIVISDGTPTAKKYFGDSAYRHVKSQVEKLEKKGFLVIQICMDNISESPKMFNKFVPYNKGEFFDSLKNVLLEKLIAFSNQV